MDARKYQIDWPGLPIKYLILSSKKKYIVFIDDENDLDWETSDEFDSRSLTDDQKKGFNNVKNEIDGADCIPTENLDEKIVMRFKRQLGEALIRNFENDFENALKMVAYAKDFILKRSLEQSRYMFLMSSIFVTALCITLFGILWMLKGYIIHLVGDTVFFVGLSSLAGSLGALLSVILRMGKTDLDYNASRKLHYLEGTCRIIAGMISALIIGVCIKSEIILPVFSKVEHTQLAMILGGLIAGASERFAPSIINKLDSTENPEKR